MNHGTVEDNAFSDKVRNKIIDKLIININRRTDLLNLSYSLHDNRVT